MQVIKSNPAFEVPREKILTYFSRGDLFLSAEVHLCFVCGAAGEFIGETTERSLRSLFVEHITSDPESKILCVRAETAATELLRQLEERRGANISLFEKAIAETVDSVLIFPESPGSFAELGYFSAHELIAERTLVAVKLEYQATSFLTLGPIHLIARVSIFGPIPIALGTNPQSQFHQITERLLGESLNKRPYRKRFVKKTWKDLEWRVQLSILDEMIDLAGALTEVDLRQLVNDIFGPYDIRNIRIILALLSATKRIARNDDGDLFSTKKEKRFIECDSANERPTIIAKWLSAYQEHFPDALEQLERFRA